MKYRNFYITNFTSVQSLEETDLSAIPPLVRRKLSEIDKLAVSVMEQVFEEGIQEIVFASKSGEIGRLNKIISEYKELNEVSPSRFSGSVHNYPVGFFTLYNKLNLPYYALASGENSISAGLVKSIISPFEKVLFCYADEKALGCVISKSAGDIKCAFSEEDKVTDKIDEYSAFCDFIQGKISAFRTVFGTVMRVEE